MWIRLAYCLLLLCLAPFARAAETESSALIQELEQLDASVLDHPHHVAEEASRILRSLDRSSHPGVYAFSLALSLAETKDAQIAPSLIAALAEARLRQDRRGTIALLLRQVVLLRTQAPRADIEAMLGEAETLAAERNDPILQAKVWYQKAEYYGSKGEFASALLTIKNALLYLDSKKSQDAVIYHAIRDTMAGNFYAKGQVEEALAIWRECLVFFREKKQRWSLANVLYNMAYVGSRADPVLSRQQFQEALEISQQIGAKELQAATYYGLGMLAQNEKPAEAQSHFRRAYTLYRELQDFEFVAVSGYSLIDMLRQSRQLKEAQQLLDEIEANVPKDFAVHHERIFHLRYSLAMDAGDHKKALESLTREFTSYKERKGTEESQQLQRISSELGLQVEAERNKNLQQVNEAQEKEARLFRTFALILVALLTGILGLLGLVLAQNRKVKESQRSMRLILDHIDEGLFTIDAGGSIGSDYSRRLQDIVGEARPLAGESAIDLIFKKSLISEEDLSVIHEIIAVTMREEQLAWDMNAENLPAEMRMSDERESIVTLRWIPIFDAAQQLEKILVCLYDVTESRSLEQAYGQQRRHLQALPETLQEMLQGQPDRIERLLHNTEAVIRDIQPAAPKMAIMRRLHTEKGVARTLGLHALSHELHDLETCLQANTLQGSMGLSLPKLIRGVDERLAEYKAMIQVLAGWRNGSRHFSWLGEILNPHLLTWSQFLEKEQLRLCRLSVSDGVIQWPGEDQELVEEICLHSINNSLEHGFVFPRQRGQRVESPDLQVLCGRLENRFWIEIRDNGAGLDESRLKAIAGERHFIPEDDQTVADVVFFDGVSTAQQLTISSGRGVGLAAVRARVEERGGKIRIRALPERGTVLRAEWNARIPSS